jgi:glycopeptide antibiotics resistance protein
VGSFDVDDIVLNTLGGLVGFILYYTVNKLVGKWYKK